jgi:hypothetical protein
MFNSKLWINLNDIRSDVFALQDYRDRNRNRIASLEHNQDRLMRRTDARLTILEDAVSRVARTLDANHITEACMHCGQVKPEDWKKSV